MYEEHLRQILIPSLIPGMRRLQSLRIEVFLWCIQGKIRVIDYLTQLAELRSEKETVHRVMYCRLDCLIDSVVWLIDDTVELVGIGS